MYARKLGEEPKVGEKPLVLFTAGGTGAGKSTAVDNLGIAKEAQIVYESNMNNYGSAQGKIDQALAAGKSAVVAFVYREPVEAFVNGALTRAMSQESHFGSGRTLPIEAHASSHIDSYHTVQKLQEHFAGNPRVRFTIIDNSHGFNGQKRSSFDKLPKPPTALSLIGKLYASIDNAYREGHVSKSVYHGFTGHAPPTT